MRRAPAQKREVDPDPVFRSMLVAQVINKVLLKGKKDLARSIVYDALETVEQRTSQDPTIVLKRAVDNIRPAVEVRSRRVGGSSYQVPIEVSSRRSISPTRSSTPPTTPEQPSNAKKMSTRWRSPTRPSPITAGETQPDNLKTYPNVPGRRGLENLRDPNHRTRDVHNRISSRSN